MYYVNVKIKYIILCHNDKLLMRHSLFPHLNVRTEILKTKFAGFSQLSRHHNAIIKKQKIPFPFFIFCLFICLPMRCIPGLTSHYRHRQ